MHLLWDNKWMKQLQYNVHVADIYVLNDMVTFISFLVFSTK